MFASHDFNTINYTKTENILEYLKKTCVRLSFLLSKTIFFSKTTPSCKKSNTCVGGEGVILYRSQPPAVKYRSVPIHYSSCRPVRPLASERHSVRPPPTTNNVLHCVTVPAMMTTCTKVLTVTRWPPGGDRTLISRKIHFQTIPEKTARNRLPDEQVSARFLLTEYVK